MNADLPHCRSASRGPSNGHPALAAYLPDDQQDCRGYGIMALTVTDGRITSITGFPDPSLFPVFGLPERA